MRDHWVVTEGVDRQVVHICNWEVQPKAWQDVYKIPLDDASHVHNNARLYRVSAQGDALVKDLADSREQKKSEMRSDCPTLTNRIGATELGLVTAEAVASLFEMIELLGISPPADPDDKEAYDKAVRTLQRFRRFARWSRRTARTLHDQQVLLDQASTAEEVDAVPMPSYQDPPDGLNLAEIMLERGAP